MRSFAHRILAMLSLCASLAPLEGGGVMSMTFGKVGAQRLMRVWSNPYITDGLVAMWDAEWPNGIGGHTAQTATEWVDLIKGSVYGRGTNILYNAEGKYFDTNKIGWSDAARFNYPPMYMEGISYEVVFKCDYASGNWRTFFGATNGGYFILGGSDVARLNPQGSSRYYDFPKGEWHNASYVLSNTSSLNAFMYFDGTLVVNGGCVKGNVSYAACPNNSAGHVSGCMSCVRVYNRILSDSEIASNYAVDKARFNLPSAT